MRLLVTPRRALACVCAGGALPFAASVAWIVVVRYARRQGL